MMAPIVSFLIKFFYILAYPLSLYLDWQFGVGHDKKRFNRKDLKTLIQLHQNNHDSSNNGLNEKEVRMITKIIDLSDITVSTIMVPIE